MTIARLIAGREQQIVSCTPRDTVHAAARLLAERRIGALPVIDRGRVVGIFSERDLLYCVATHGESALVLVVANVMTAPPISVDPRTSVFDALELMTRRRIRHLPVIEDDALAGFVSIGDLVKHRIDMAESEAEAMRDYIRTA